jgi:hypothetical protein
MGVRRKEPDMGTLLVATLGRPDEVAHELLGQLSKANCPMTVACVIDENNIIAFTAKPEMTLRELEERYRRYVLDVIMPCE